MYFSMMYGVKIVFYKSLHDPETELCQFHLITGEPHGVNQSLLNLFGVCLYMGRINALLVEKQLDRILLCNENHSIV